jgi:hypothetical protein
MIGGNDHTGTLGTLRPVIGVHARVSTTVKKGGSVPSVPCGLGRVEPRGGFDELVRSYYVDRQHSLHVDHGLSLVGMEAKPMTMILAGGLDQYPRKSLAQKAGGPRHS